MVSWGPHSKVAKLRLITCILAGQPTIVTITSGAKPQCKPLALGTFEPTLQGSNVIYTIHGFTAGAFTLWEFVGNLLPLLLALPVRLCAANPCHG